MEERTGKKKEDADVLTVLPEEYVFPATSWHFCFETSDFAQ